MLTLLFTPANTFLQFIGLTVGKDDVEAAVVDVGKRPFVEVVDDEVYELGKVAGGRVAGWQAAGWQGDRVRGKEERLAASRAIFELSDRELI